jgi:uncharacterized protein (TIGR02246 family)
MNDPATLDAIARDLTDRWAQAWNTGDAARLGALLTDDADWVTVGGRRLRGRAQIEQVHGQLFAGPLAGTTWTGQAVEVQALSAESALVSYSWTVSGERDAGGAPKPNRAGVFSWLLLRRGGAWLVRLGHGTNVAAA